MNSWIVAGLVAGVVAYLVDWVVWSKVFTTGMDAFYAQVIFGFKKPDWHAVDRYTWKITTPKPSAVLTAIRRASLRPLSRFMRKRLSR